MERATPTLPDLTINLKQCSVQPRSLKDPETPVWISWFRASRLDPTGAKGGGRLKHAPQILWKQHRDMLFLPRSCLTLAIKHPSLSTFSVCQTRKIMACCKTQKWNSTEIQTQLYLLTPNIIEPTVKPRPQSDPAPAEPFTWGKCSWVQEEQGRQGKSWKKWSVLVLLCSWVPHAIFSHMWKNVDASVYLIGGTSNSPQEHPIFYFFFLLLLRWIFEPSQNSSSVGGNMDKRAK